MNYNKNKINELSVVIVTHNSRKYIVPCLKSIINSRNVNLKEIIIVDNASTDGTPEIIEKIFNNSGKLRIVRLSKNMGFPYGCNVGVRLARSKFVVLMNPDVIVEPDCFARLVDFLSTNEDVAVVQPKLLKPGGYIDSAGGMVDVLGHGFHLGCCEKSGEQYEKPRDIFYATFACVMVRRDIYLKLGGMDSRFFLYNEDVDFSWRSWLAGYRVVYLPSAIAYHVGQHSTRRIPYHAIYFGRRNRLYTIFTNYPLGSSILFSLLLMGFYIILGVRLAITDPYEARLTFRIINRLFKDLRYLIKKRKTLHNHIKLSELLKKGLITFKLVGVTLHLRRLYRIQLRMKDQR